MNRRQDISDRVHCPLSIVHSMPKAELHRHLEGSIPLAHQAQLLAARGDPLVGGLDALRDRTCVVQPMRSLTEVLACFDLYGQMLSTLEAVDSSTRAVVGQAADEGIVYLELRFSPGFIGQWCPAPEAEIIRCVAAAAQQEAAQRDLHVSLLVIATRELGAEVCAAAFHAAAEHMGVGVVGVDLAGDEDLYPLSTFARPVALAGEAGLSVTIHAGETGNPAAVREAVEDLGASRVGHGIAAADDPSVAPLLREPGVALEISITSNWIVGAVPPPEAPPLRRLRDLGVPVTVNTDDPALFDVTLGEELRLAGRILDLDAAGLLALQRAAVDAGFGPRAARARALERMARWES